MSMSDYLPFLYFLYVYFFLRANKIANYVAKIYRFFSFFYTICLENSSWSKNEDDTGL